MKRNSYKRGSSRWPRSLRSIEIHWNGWTPSLNHNFNKQHLHISDCFVFAEAFEARIPSPWTNVFRRQRVELSVKFESVQVESVQVGSNHLSQMRLWCCMLDPQDRRTTNSLRQTFQIENFNESLTNASFCIFCSINDLSMLVNIALSHWTSVWFSVWKF